MDRPSEQFNQFWDQAPGNPILDHYAKFANEYDTNFNDDHYQGPMFIAEEAEKHIPADKRADVRVMDIASGTGQVGKVMTKFGFVHIDGVEPVLKQVTKCKTLKIYDRIIEDIVSDERPLDVPDRTYDLVVCSGSFVPNHLPVTALDEMLRITKPGGFIIFVMREEYIRTDEKLSMLEPHIKKLADKEQIRVVSRAIKPHYFFEQVGLIYVLERTRP